MNTLDDLTYEHISLAKISFISSTHGDDRAFRD